MLEKNQSQLKNYIRGDTARKWLSKEYIETDKLKGGLGFFNIRDFIDGLKVAWINRYTKGTNDRW